jgi:uncharacterized protein YecE (DUF72 family)
MDDQGSKTISGGYRAPRTPAQVGLPFPELSTPAPAPAWVPDQRILVGTSGYSFADWVGRFYPARIPRSEMLPYYSEHFPVVEVNTTFYRIPHPRVMEQMEKKTPPGFRFLVKGPQSLTHERRLDAESIAAFQDCLEPLRAAGKLDGVLLQFPWSFKPDSNSWRLLAGARQGLSEHKLFVEFRHASWDQPETFTRLRDHALGYCVVDEPRLEGLMPPVVELTSPAGYVRFHGRNSATWWGRGRGDRYDYLYSDAELREWVGKIHDLAARAERVYVFFNNCHAGQAARNAQLMQQLLLAEA